jgi:hypothetical protein
MSSHQNHVRTFPISHTCHMSRPSTASWFDNLNDTWAVQIQIFIMQSLSLPSYLVSLKPKYLLSTLFSNTLSLATKLVCVFHVFLSKLHSQSLLFFRFIILDTVQLV